MRIKAYNITLNGKVYQVEVEEVQLGQNPIQTVSQESTKSAPVTNVSGEEIIAPMPGNMFNILVKEGQSVKRGDVVAILEAMKMENEIIAPVDGTISTIHVEKGQNVNLGDVILKIA